MFCYAFGFVLLVLTKYNECEGAHKFTFNEKEWLIVYIIICLGNVAKYQLSSKIDLLYNEGEMT